MEFQKYSSLENHYRQKTIDFYRMHGLEKVSWVLTEKVHGANFSFWSDGEDFKVASRNQFVDGSFYSCTDIIEKHRNDVLRISAMFPGKTVIVYGELYGPGIQKGIDYGTKKDFIVFDIKVDGEYLPWLELEEVLDKTEELRAVPELAIVDCLTDALAYNNQFVSELGRLNGVESTDNITEGLVMKPLLRENFRIGGERVIIKSKNDKWSEKSKKPKAPKTPTEQSPLVAAIDPYVNANRLAAVTSKMGVITPKDFGLVIKAMTEDVIEDMVKDGEVRECWRDDDETKNLGKVVNSRVVPFLKAELLPNL
jgi:Rnl2 family RNA ligase